MRLIFVSNHYIEANTACFGKKKNFLVTPLATISNTKARLNLRFGWECHFDNSQMICSSRNPNTNAIWRCHLSIWLHGVIFRQVILPVGHFHGADQAICLLIPTFPPRDQLFRNSESYRLYSVVKGYERTQCLCPIAVIKTDTEQTRYQVMFRLFEAILL